MTKEQEGIKERESTAWKTKEMYEGKDSQLSHLKGQEKEEDEDDLKTGRNKRKGEKGIEDEGNV